MTDRHGRKKKSTIERGMMQTATFIRKPFPVEAVQVTEENMDVVAAWCMGNLQLDEKADKFIKVRVHQPLTQRQTQAYVGDWVLYANNGYKVYTDKAFGRAFQSAVVEPLGADVSTMDEAVKNVFDNNEPRGYSGPVPPVNAGSDNVGPGMLGVSFGE